LLKSARHQGVDLAGVVGREARIGKFVNTEAECLAGDFYRDREGRVELVPVLPPFKKAIDGTNMQAVQGSVLSRACLEKAVVADDHQLFHEGDGYQDFGTNIAEGSAHFGGDLKPSGHIEVLSIELVVENRLVIVMAEHDEALVSKGLEAWRQGYVSEENERKQES
jgi:hypothetical protein